MMGELRFERFHPIVAFLYYSGAAALILLMLHPIFLCAGLFVLLVVNYSHDHLKGLRRAFFWMLAAVLLMVLLNPLFNERGRHVLFVIKEHRFTLEAFVYNGMNALALVGVIAVFISYNIVMKPNKLLFLFAKFLPQFAVLLMLTLRFIPLMRRRVGEIALVQRSKGLSAVSGNWTAKVKNAMQYIQILVTFSLEEAIQTADSMKARGYGSGPRTVYEHFRLRGGDICALFYLSLLVLVCIAGRIGGFGFLQVYPLMESWRLEAADVQVFSGYLLFLSFPLFVEAGGMIRWRILK